MDPFEYQKLAKRTECNQSRSYDRIGEEGPTAIRMIHAALGLTSDAGEVAACIERWLYYGRDFDRLNLIEELGDCLWYIAQMCNALDIDMGNVMATNIAKLKKRYPDKFISELADEERRDRKEEIQAVSDTLEVTSPDACSCPSCGSEERVHDVTDMETELRILCSNKNCPTCGTPVSDAVVKRVYLGLTPNGGCPNCEGQFEVETKINVTTGKIERLNLKRSN